MWAISGLLVWVVLGLPFRVAGSFVVLASVVVHGATSTPFTKWYGRATGHGEGRRTR